MRRVLILLCALVGIAALIPNCGAVFAGGAQGQNAPSETKAYVRKVMGDAAQPRTLTMADLNAIWDKAHPAKPTALTMADLNAMWDKAHPAKPTALTMADLNAIWDKAHAPKPPAATQPPPPRQPITLTKVDYDPFAPQPWYRQPINSGQQKMAAWLLLGVSVLMLFVITRMRWFNHLHVGWNRLIVALSGLWLLAVGSMLILVGGIPVEGWFGIVYAPVFTLWALYKLTAWVISGFGAR